MVHRVDDVHPGPSSRRRVRVNEVLVIVRPHVHAVSRSAPRREEPRRHRVLPGRRARHCAASQHTRAGCPEKCLHRAAHIVRRRTVRGRFTPHAGGTRKCHVGSLLRVVRMCSLALRADHGGTPGSLPPSEIIALRTAERYDEIAESAEAVLDARLVTDADVANVFKRPFSEPEPPRAVTTSDWTAFAVPWAADAADMAAEASPSASSAFVLIWVIRLPMSGHVPRAAMTSDRVACCCVMNVPIPTPAIVVDGPKVTVPAVAVTFFSNSTPVDHIRMPETRPGAARSRAANLRSRSRSIDRS